MIEELALKLKELIEITNAKITELASKIAAAERKETESNDFIHKLKAEGKVLKDRESKCLAIENFEVATAKLKESNSRNAEDREKLVAERERFTRDMDAREEKLQLMQEAINKDRAGIFKQQKQLDQDRNKYKDEILKQMAQEDKK